jgi:ADP-heptose:LPS heptosyltransferase
LIELLKQQQFDAVVIFTVYSQSPLPAALTCLMAGIPLRLACCRENPYDLLSHWLPDEEPYAGICHQVERDLKLVNYIGASSSQNNLTLTVTTGAVEQVQNILAGLKIDLSKPYIILHPGVSEEKRQYPAELWITAAKLLQQQFNCPLLLTGAASEKTMADNLQEQMGNNVFVLAGLLTIEMLLAVIKKAMLIVTVNTSTVHIASALQTPQIVLYALTNPQHTPWQTKARVLYFPVREELTSKSPIIKYVAKQTRLLANGYPQPDEIVEAAKELLR